jgi:hypothetical protein
MNWKLDPNDPYIWQVEGAPFGVEKIDHACYAPFRLWNNNRLYVGEYTSEGRKDLLFRSRREAMDYVEKAVKSYRASIITAV